MGDNEKRVALVTGGSRGIGLGIARCLASAGFDLAIQGRRAERDVARPLAHIQELGARTLYCQADVSRLDDHRPMLESIRAEFGRLDVLVNKAGAARDIRADWLDTTPESFDGFIRIMLRGPYFLTKLAAKWLIEQRLADDSMQGSIINVSSNCATEASAKQGEHSISKAGLSMATRLWAVRLGEYGIPVYEVRPGIIRTDMSASVTEKYDRLIADGLTIEPRWGAPEDIGRAVTALASGELSYATGAVLPIDGGLTLERL